MSLQDLDIKDTYSSSTRDNDLILEFYNPVIEQSISYDRITGYFSPTVLVIASRGFASLIGTGGKIRLITSVQLDDRTYDSIVNSGDSLDENLLTDFDPETIKSEIDKDYLAVFAWLYRTGQLEMKVAITSKERTMLHQKIGIITDSEGNSISFSGSNNETPHGWIHNIEQFKVFKSWNPHTSSFFQSDKEEFDILWNNLSNKAKVLDIGMAIKDKLIEKMDKHRKDNISTVVSRIKKHENKIRIVQKRHSRTPAAIDPTNKASSNDKDASPSHSNDHRQLFAYQKDAINHWAAHHYKSMFEMATGTGKTFTTINAIKEFSHTKGYLRAVVVVPLKSLTIQWQSEIQKILPNYRIINTSVDNDWRSTLHSLHMSKLLNDTAEDFIIITSYKMFSNPKFAQSLSNIADDYILVADEMHNLVTERAIIAAQNGCYKFKLGLSATPTRLWKPEESAFVGRLFGANSFSYNLKDALDANFLVPYRYHPIFTYMSVDEYEEYQELSKTIARLYAASKGESDSTILNSKLIARARIKKNTISKLLELERAVSQLDSSGDFHHALIYVDNEDFLQDLQRMLSANYIITTKFLGSTLDDERIRIIKNLRSGIIKAIVAIKCLDEGVDIPSAQSAFFLSNNTDPREYVQRLGRVLRRDDEGGKDSADVYDFIVLPPYGSSFQDESSKGIARNLMKNELRRAIFFEEYAINGDDAKQQVEDKLDEYGFVFNDEELSYEKNNEEDA